jgi:hypothetical protein
MRLSLLYLTSIAAVRAQLIQQTWNSLAFAPQAEASSTQIPALNFSSASNFPALCSVRFSGTITDSSTELVNFTVFSEGGVRLWVNDWLVVDGAGGNVSGTPRFVKSFLNIPFTAGAPLPFRLEYSRWGGSGDAVLQLFWSGNSTSLSIVPSSAFSPTLSNFLVQRNALRDRLEVPRVPWQTYSMASMGSHVLMPAGFALTASLSAVSTNATLKSIIPFRNGNPALVRPGLRSLNGSDYTLLTISSWNQVENATVVFETTVVGGTDLIFLASCTGSGCTDMLLVVEPVMMEERAGSLSAGADGRSLSAELPGFSTVVAAALGDVPPVPSRCGGSAELCIALPLSSPVGYWTGAGTPPSVAEAQSAIATAAAAALAAETPFGDLAPLYEGLRSALAWNTVYSPYEGVITPVSHVMGNIWGLGYILFEWDTYFLALMASLQDGIARDLAYANLIQVTLGRTVAGFVPNGGAGPRRTYDRSEDQVGALILKTIYDKWGDAWLLEGLLPVMLTWNDWVWARRRGEGALAGADGFSDLMCLGSDPSSPRSDTQCTLQAARYEGMDNSAIYDAPPAFYNSTTHHMNVYDVAATALFASDTEATIALCAAAGAGACPVANPPLADRLSRVQAAMNANMWDEEHGLYANRLFNGSAISVFAPTSVFPMLSGTPTDAQAVALASALASPNYFCYNVTHTPEPDAEMLVQLSVRDGGRRATCITAECTRDAIFDDFSFLRVEAVALRVEGGPAPGLVPLNLFVNAATGATALVDGDSPPDAAYTLVRQEGWCWGAAPASNWPTTQLSLWRATVNGEYMTCGTAACENDAAYTRVRSMCYAYNGTGPENMPCRVGGASVARADPSFLDQSYWRGRAWGPHHMLIYLGLKRYDHVPEVRSARLDLVKMGARIQLENWDANVVCENVNGIIGTCEDSGNADPFYTWGALFGFTSFMEAGLF